MAGHTSFVWQWVCRKHFLQPSTGSVASITLCRVVCVPEALPSGCAKSTSLCPAVVLSQAIPPAGRWVCQQHFPLGVPKALPSAWQRVSRKHLPLPNITGERAKPKANWAKLRPGQSGCAESTTLLVRGRSVPHDCRCGPSQDQLAKGDVARFWPQQELHKEHPRPGLDLVLSKALPTRPV
jgi:hypothetical protein